MTADAPYIIQRESLVTRTLQRAGRWAEALAALPADALLERAEVLVDRYFWQVEGLVEAAEAVSALEAHAPRRAAYLDAQLRYGRRLFEPEQVADDLDRIRSGFAGVAGDPPLTGWSDFWLGVLADNVDGSPDTSGPAFARALDHARESGDALLESYAVRHIGGHLLERDREEGVRLLRRSYLLRASLGARPQTAAAAVLLAGELPPGPEADELRETAGSTARELGLTWLLQAV